MSVISEEKSRQLRERAAECRELASVFAEQPARAKMLAIAEKYEQLAETNDEDAAQHPGPSREQSGL
jgi:hypothetical protein